jgi:hypothetical protein
MCVAISRGIKRTREWIERFFFVFQVVSQSSVVSVVVPSCFFSVFILFFILNSRP